MFENKFGRVNLSLDRILQKLAHHAANSDRQADASVSSSSCWAAKIEL